MDEKERRSLLVTIPNIEHIPSIGFYTRLCLSEPSKPPAFLRDWLAEL